MDTAWVWPAACAGCGRRGEARLCHGCRAVGVHRARVHAQGVRGTFTLAAYDTGLGHAVRAAKVHADRVLASELADLAVRRLAPVLASGGWAAIVPAPSTPWHTFRRGFSLPALVAVRLGPRLEVPVDHLIRRRHGARQAGLDATQRRTNLRGRVRCEWAPAGRILLVDDVATTGATAEACAMELLGAGASEVWLATLCVAGVRRDDDGYSAGASVSAAGSGAAEGSATSAGWSTSPVTSA